MSRDDPKVNFSGTFTAGQMQIAGRDMTVTGSNEGRIGELHLRLADVAAIRDVLPGVSMAEDDRKAASAAVDTLEQELARPEPNETAAAAALERLTSIVKAAGGLALAGVALVDPIARIAVTLGSAAAGVLRAIGR
jgi:hypothetical protein